MQSNGGSEKSRSRQGPGRRLVTDAAADVGVEYALLLAVVGATLVLAAQMLGVRQQQAFEAVAAHTVLAAGEGKPVSLVQVPLDAIAPVGGLQSMLSINYVYTIPLTAVAVALLAAGWYGARRRRLQAERIASTASVESSTGGQARYVAKRQSIMRALGSDIRGLLESRITVRQLMTVNVMTARPAVSTDTLRSMMQTNQMRHVPVCEEGGRLIGIVSDRDLQTRKGTRACDVMTAEPIFVSPEAPLGPAVTLMLERQISSLPVVENDRLRGVLTTVDLAMALQCLLHVIARLSHDTADAAGAGDTVRVAGGAPTVALPVATMEAVVNAG